MNFLNSLFKKKKKNQTKPFSGEIEAATRQPGGYVYRIEGVRNPDQAVPPEAIVGAWKVNNEGVIEGDFQHNPNYIPRSEPVGAGQPDNPPVKL